MDMSYRRLYFRIITSAIETIGFGIILYLWKMPIPIMRNEPLIQPFRHLADIPEVLGVIGVGVIVLLAGIFHSKLPYALQLFCLALLQVVWAFAIIGFGMGYLDLSRLTMAPWALYLSIFVFIRNWDNIYTYVVLEDERKLQIKQLNQIQQLEDAITVTEETTKYVSNKLEGIHDKRIANNRKAGKDTKGNDNL